MTEEKEPAQNQFRFTDPRQDRIHRRLLQRIGPGPAAFYLDACKLMLQKQPMPTTSHLVGHLLRDIESAMRGVLKMVVDTKDRKSIKKNGSEKHKRQIILILKALKISEDDPIAKAWLDLTGKDNSEALHRKAHRRDLSSPRPMDKGFREFWERMELILDVVLDKFETRFLDLFKILDGLLDKPSPTDSDITLLVNHIPNSLVTRGYFFDKLTSEEWLQPLQDEGFFKEPPTPIQNVVEGTINFPPWPESGYIARMAKNTQDKSVFNLVLDIMLEIPDTENFRVHEDLAEAACALPVHLSKEWVKKEIPWIAKENIFHILPEKLGALVSHLAKGGQIEAALDLARTLLEVLPDPHVAEETDENQTYRPSPEPRPRFDKWDYKEIIKKNIPDLVKVAPQKSINLLCGLLNSAIRFSRHSNENQGSEDNSFIWRPIIGGKQDHLYSLRDLLITSVRDTAEQITRADDTQLPIIISNLEEHHWHVFKRISLYLLNLFPASAELIREHLLNEDLLDGVGWQVEYDLLLKNRFTHLLPTEQEAWLDLIEQGPPLEMGKERPGTPEEIEQSDIRWRKYRLAVIIDQLPSEWCERHQEWTDGLANSDDFPRRPVRITSWVGPTSPKSLEELKTMSVSDLVPFLHSWQPPDGHFDPSPEGLGRQLTTAVAEDPARFAQETLLFQKLDPTYVRSIIQGLEEACKAKKTFDWVTVLQFCLWIVAQPREVLDRKLSGEGVDPDWGWTRKVIARLLAAGFESTAFEIPYILRQEVWSVLEPLTHDPDPSQKHEAEYGVPNMAPATLSINTVRGDAMHTLIRYALWVRRHLEKLPDAKEKLDRGFDEMPEVCEVLDEHLQVERDPALAVRSVYGQWFPWLVLLDIKWVTRNVSIIFPHEEDARGLRNAAWEAYITFCRAYDNVFEILQDEYAWSLDHLSEGSDNRDSVQSKEKLVEHLAIFYLRAKLRLHEPNGILSRFYQNAPHNLHAYLIEFIGRSFNDDKTKISPEILDLTKTLWTHHFEACSSSSKFQELIPFGWWFSSGKLDDLWAISELIKVLKITGEAEFAHNVVERLEVLASSLPSQVIEALKLMIIGDKKGWGITGWRVQIRSIISTVKQNENEEAQEAAIDLVHRLGALGYLEFRDLLPND